MPQWRWTIRHSAPTGKAVTLINYERTKSLLRPPPVSTKRSTRAKNNELARLGVPRSCSQTLSHMRMAATWTMAR